MLSLETMDYDSLIARAEDLMACIEMSIDNFYTHGSNSVTRVMVTTRLNVLENNWQELREICTELQRKGMYNRVMINEAYCLIEEKYIEALTLMRSYLEPSLDSLVPTVSPPVIVPNGPNFLGNDGKLQCFSGDYDAWPRYRGTFVTTVCSCAYFNNFDRMYYLKMSLEGEAAHLIRDMTIEDGNFSRAWEILKETYDNPRKQSDDLVVALHALKPATKETADELRRVLYGVTDIVQKIRRLQNREIPDAMLVGIMMCKLDPMTCDAWNQSIACLRTMVNFRQMSNFLTDRILMLATLPVSRLLARYNSR